MERPYEGLTISDIAVLISKTESYVSRKLNDLGITPEGKVHTSTKGPASSVWREETINRLIASNRLSNRVLNKTIWYDSKRTKVYLVRFKLNVDGKSIDSYKIGITDKKDIIEGRFAQEVKSGVMSDISVIAFKEFDNRLDAEEYETYLFNLVKDKFGGYQLKDGSTRFHNFWTQQQPKGITEMRSWNEDEAKFVKNLLFENA